MDLFFESLIESYNFTVLDLTPITSMLLSFGRILYAINFEGTWFYKYSPGTYLATSYMIQFINLIFYGILLILMEAGHLRKFLNYIQLKLCINEKFVFSQEEISDEFLRLNIVSSNYIIFLY